MKADNSVTRWIIMPRALVPAAVVAALCACGPSLTQVKTFAAAAQTVSQNAKASYNLIDDSVADRKMYAVAATTDGKPTDDTFKGFFDSAAGGVKTKGLQARLKLLSSLGDYAGSLQLLAEADVQGDVDSASKELFGALGDMQDTYTQASGKSGLISDAKLGVISSAVSALGSAYWQYKRRRAMRKIIAAADEPVQECARLITTDLSPKTTDQAGSDMGRYVEDNLDQVYSSMGDAYLDASAKPGSTFEKRLKLLQDMRAAYDRKASVKALFSALASSAETMAKAHSELRAATTSRSFTSDQAASAITKLAANTRTVKALYKQWNKGE